ncbi:MAG: hypothetical protein IPN29_00460 [Saprospiraceae bacterium]|nr:hypothetical protein [Saprospiraceae bacterium]
MKTFDIILTSYQTLLRDEVLFSKIDFRYIVLDEAHYIKNRESKIFQVVRSPGPITAFRSVAHRLKTRCPICGRRWNLLIRRSCKVMPILKSTTSMPLKNTGSKPSCRS